LATPGRAVNEIENLYPIASIAILVSAPKTICHNHAVSITEIAGYRVIRQLGAGGMGQVFLVQHPRLPRQDALKLLDAGVSRNDEFKARFQREADLLAQLSHSNIVTLHDRGEFEGRLWITMEYVDGTDAAELLKAGGPKRYATYMQQRFSVRRFSTSHIERNTRA
jgi:serine/threonine protein kinase